MPSRKVAEQLYAKKKGGGRTDSRHGESEVEAAQKGKDLQYPSGSIQKVLRNSVETQNS